jgi:hypothetical protein
MLCAKFCAKHRENTLNEAISTSELAAQRTRYVQIRDEAARVAKVLKNTAMAPDLEELVRCTNAALAALDRAIEITSQKNHG